MTLVAYPRFWQVVLADRRYVHSQSLMYCEKPTPHPAPFEVKSGKGRSGFDDD
jgi:hypothetical protein